MIQRSERDWPSSAKLQDGIRLRGSAGYAAPTDFCRIFKEDMGGLYTLCLLLTADHEKAEQCFVAALDDCINGNPVFQEWARSWTRWVVIRNAIRMIVPVPARQPQRGKEVSIVPEADGPAAAVMRLQPFDRFVFVILVLEGYRIRECAVLLKCTSEEVVRARTRALQHIGRVGDALPTIPAQLQLDSALVQGVDAA